MWMSELTCGFRCLRCLHLAVHDRQADPEPAGDLAQRLAFGVTCADCAALVLVDHARSSPFAAVSCCGFQAIAGLAGDVATPVFGQGERQVQDQAAFGVLAGGDAVQDLHRDPLLEKIVEHDQAFEEVAAETVGFLHAVVGGVFVFGSFSERLPPCRPWQLGRQRLLVRGLLST